MIISRRGFSVNVNLFLLPESISELLELQKIVISDCKCLGKLPESIVRLQNLKEVVVERCENFSLLPEEREKLEKLQRLSVSTEKDIPGSGRFLCEAEIFNMCEG